MNYFIWGILTDGFYEFIKESTLWSISKGKWIKGPEFPHKRGIEEGCATLLNQSVVLVIGITKLESKYYYIFIKRTIHVRNFGMKDPRELGTSIEIWHTVSSIWKIIKVKGCNAETVHIWNYVG